MIDSIGSGTDLQQMMLERFKKIDTDENGSLNQDEFQVLADKMLEDTGESMDFSSVDTDGDEEISFEELNALHEKHMHPMGKGMPNFDEMFQEQFDEVDSDGNGTLNETEFATLMEKFSVQAGGNSDSDSDSESDSTTISSIDTDGDGEISAEELREYFESKRPSIPPNFHSAYNTGTENTNTTENSIFSFLA